MINLLKYLLVALLLHSASNITLAQTALDDDFFRELVATQYVEPFLNGDIDRWIRAFDPQAIALHNRRPADRGRDAIEAFGRTVHEYFILQEYDVQVTDIRRSPDWVYTVGLYTTHFVAKADGSEPFGREQGKFMLLWERQEDDSWKIILDTGNSNQ